MSQAVFLLIWGDAGRGRETGGYKRSLDLGSYHGPALEIGKLNEDWAIEGSFQKGDCMRGTKRDEVEVEHIHRKRDQSRLTMHAFESARFGMEGREPH